LGAVVKIVFTGRFDGRLVGELVVGSLIRGLVVGSLIGELVVGDLVGELVVGSLVGELVVGSLVGELEKDLDGANEGGDENTGNGIS